MRMERFAGLGGKAYVLRNARVPLSLVEGYALRDIDRQAGLATTDLPIADGRLASPDGDDGRDAVDLEAQFVLPGFVDMHVHLDKAHTVRRTGLPGGGLMDAAALSAADAPNRTVEDLARRMEFALQCAFHHGTVALRTHLDTPGMPDETPAWQVFDDLRRAWSGRIALEGCALMSVERADTDDFPTRCAQLAARGGVLGAFIAPGMAPPDRLDRLFAQAGRHGLDVDFHVDETLDPDARALEAIAEAVLRTGYGGRVVAGHCCSLSAMPRGAALAILDKVAQAGLHVVALPLTNLFLQDRAGEATPTRRGITLVREMRARAIPVSFASDNVCDPFYPYGDFDMLEVMHNAVRLAHLEGEAGAWIGAASATPAQSCGFPGRGRIAPGAPADLIHFAARDWFDLFSRPHARRLVIRDGVALAGTVPVRQDFLAPIAPEAT